MKKGFEEFERYMFLKINSEKLSTHNDINAQAEFSMKVLDEFRIRLGEVE